SADHVLIIYQFNGLSSSPTIKWASWTLLVVTPFLAVLLWAVISPGRAVMQGWCVAVLGIIVGVMRWIAASVLDNEDYVLGPGGYLLVVVPFVIACLGIVQIVYRSRFAT